jgi:alpha-2-macroglobulin
MKKLTAWTLALSIYLGFFGFIPPPASAQVSGTSMEQMLKDLPPGLQFRLSEGTENAEKREKQSPSAADPLSDSKASDLLKRVPNIKTAADDQSDFSKRIGTLPAPKTGSKIPVRFPADSQRQGPGVDTSGQLQVIRYSPEGEVPLAPDLNVTFSHPMVAVTSQQQASKFAPVELSPQVQGNWRWLGTKTLMFDTDKRFPMATKFTARVPAGTKAATGQALAKDAIWTFTTPPPKMESSFPNGIVTRRDALIFISFDQAINPQAVIKTISVSAQGRKLLTRLATSEEIEKGLSAYVKGAQPNRWIALRVVNSDGSTENALPAVSAIAVTLEKGTPSAEGPLTTTKAQTFSFTTYGPFKFKRSYCGWPENKTCNPFEGWVLEMSNPIDPAKFTREMVKIDPPVEGMNIFPSGNQIYLQGYKKGRTTYKVTVDASLTDEFGQRLGEPATATFRVGPGEANLYAQGGFMTVLDPTAKPSFSVYSTNHNSAKVRLYRVAPEDWNQYQEYVRRLNYDDGKRPPIPGALVSDTTIQIASKPDEMVETRIDISKGLSDGLGNVIVIVEPTVPRDRNDRTRVISWLQATQIGLDAFVDNTELVAFATELATGKALPGVALSIHPNGSGGPIASVTPDEPGYLTQAWEWITSWGGDTSSGPNADVAETETIEPAQDSTTKANGILRLALSEKRPDKQNILIARRGKDVSFLPENSDYYWQEAGSWYRKDAGHALRWYVFDDRKMYKPKEEVSVKGWIRRVDMSKLGDVEPVDRSEKLLYTIADPRGSEIGKGETTLNPFGGFNLKVKLPDNVNLGYATINFSLMSAPGSVYATYSHQFQIQEFRRPEFEVTSKVDTEAPHFVGGSAMLSVEAKYYAGGPLANAETNWTVTANPTNYTPPNRDDFTFGTWTPWWGAYGHGMLDGMRGGPYYGGGASQSFKGVTDESGKHLLKIDFDSVKPPRPYAVTAASSVQDVNRQTWSSTTSLLVHPSSLYVGIRTPRTFVQKGEKIDIETIVTDIDGKLISGRDVEIKAVLKDWQFDKGSWKEVTIDEQVCTVKSLPEGPKSGPSAGVAKCSFIAKNGGRYTITATVMDDRERYNQSEITVWVPGGKTPPKRGVEQEEVQIIPSKKDFVRGDVAELLVIAPFAPAEGVLTLRRDGIVKTEGFSIKESSATIKIPIDEKYLPNVVAQVDLVGAAQRTNDKGEPEPKLSKRPAFASGNIDLKISTTSRKLAVTADAVDKTLIPGGETKVNVQVKDFRGEPVADGEVAIVVVDESVLALASYIVPDPISIFYTERAPGVIDHHSRKDVLLGNPEDVKASPPPPPPSVTSSDASVGNTFSSQQLSALPTGGAARLMKRSAGVLDGVAAQEREESKQPGITLRQNFNALALFSPTVRTDSNGKAVVDLKLPDNLTRYRVTAVAVDKAKRFGKSESNITAKQPLMVRPSAPRFMNFGDKVELPVVVQNQTDQDMTVDIAIRATNATIHGPMLASVKPTPLTQDGRRVVVKANNRAEVRFPVEADKAGTARFQFVVSSGKYSDAAEISLPVWTPATTEAFATYGTTDQNGAVFQPVQAPGDGFPQFGGLELTTSSTQLQELTDAFIYLTNYPYACSEQISSRMISIAAMRDVLSAFKAKDMPTAKELEGYFARDVEILKSRQRSDGSFGLWKRDGERYQYPFLTVHAAHSLILAKSKGYKVPDDMLNRVKPYLKDVEKHFDEWYKNSPQVRWTISAYALYVRDLMGDKDAAKAKRLLAEAKSESPVVATGSYGTKLSFEALGWVLSVLADDKNSAVEVEAIIRHLMNRTTETASTANFVTDYGDGAWLIMYSNRRADGVLLEAMIKAQPNNDLIPKLVRGLLAHRTKGHWGSTQDNVFILLALDKYFNAFEKVTPDFVTRIWLGDTYAGEQTFKGRSVDSKQLDIPMSYLIGQGGTSNLILDRQGAGRLYYRIGMKYAPKNLKLEPADYGFTVLRSYEPVDDKEDVKQNADGSWTIKSGARVRIRLTMVAQARRYHVALVDNLPAGLEILNPSLAVTESIPADLQPATGVTTYGSHSYGYGSWWWRQYWFEHRNFRDERAEAFTALLWEGVYNYSYVTRATTPGQFVVPPAKAEEMYAPETFGRSGTDFVRVE